METVCVDGDLNGAVDLDHQLPCCEVMISQWRVCPFCCSRRLLQNPAYYDLEDGSPEGVSAYMSELVESALVDLAYSGCITVRCIIGYGPCKM